MLLQVSLPRNFLVARARIARGRRAFVMDRTGQLDWIGVVNCSISAKNFNNIDI
eukprot:COSAG01_NODE_56353_length_319_cov_0.586364_1_plen_53_part_10